MIHRGGLAICSDAGRCSSVRGRQIPRIHRDFGPRVNLPDPLGAGRGTHGRGLHHRRPHPGVCSRFPAVPRSTRKEIARKVEREREREREREKRKRERERAREKKHARTVETKHRREQAKAHWPPLSPVLSICPSLLLFSPFFRGRTRVETGRKKMRKLSVVLTVGPLRRTRLRWHSPPSVLVDYLHAPFPPLNVHRLVLPTYPDHGRERSAASGERGK